MNNDPTVTPPEARPAVDPASNPTSDPKSAEKTLSDTEATLNAAEGVDRFAADGTDRFAQTVSDEPGFGSNPHAATVVSEPQEASLSGSEATVNTVLGSETVATVSDAPAAQKAGKDDLPFSSIAGVNLSRLLGKGGMGAVYLGHHEHLDLDVAVKLVLPRDSLEDRFLQECRIAAKLQHENVVRVYNAGKEHDQLFLILELVTGGDVDELVKSGGQVPWRKAVDIVRQAALGLGTAHKAGIVHRDIKPGNLMLADDGTVKVADLGLAKTHECDIGLTQSGMVMGTPAYMAPEQAMDVKRAGPPADIYALGITLFVLLSGELPFKGTTSTQVILAHINDPIPYLRKLVDDVPDAVIKYMERMLAKEADDRPQEGLEVATALADILGSDATASQRPAVSAPSKAASASSQAAPNSGANKLVPIIIIAVIALIIGVVAVSMSGPSDTSNDTNSNNSADANSTNNGAGDATNAAAINDGSATPTDTSKQAPVTANDAWQSPERAAFVLANGLSPQLVIAADEALRESGLRVIERDAIDTLVQEQQLAKDGIVSTDSAIGLGKAKGGHLALIFRAVDEQAEIRAVHVETGELLGRKLVSDAAAVRSETQALIDSAKASFAAKGRISNDPIHGMVLSLGSGHGLAVDDKFYVFNAETNERLAAAATVTKIINKSTAVVAIAGTIPEGVAERLSAE